MSRYATHIKRLRDLPPSIELFYERIRPLVESPKIGPVLWQLPPGFRRDDARLAQALEQLPPGRHCFEFRDDSWFVEPVYELLREHGAALVIGDTPRREYAHELTADWTFLRFHHGKRGGNGNYSRERAPGMGVPDRRLGHPGRGLRVLQQRLERLRGPEMPSGCGAG